MRNLRFFFWPLLLCLLAGCKAPEPSVALGSSRDQLIRRLGPPTMEAVLSDGGQVLRYEFKNAAGGVPCQEQYVLSNDGKIIDSAIWGAVCR